MPEIVIHNTFKQQFGVHSVELGTEFTEPFVAIYRNEHEISRQYFYEYVDAFRAFSLVQMALDDIDNEGYGYEEDKANEAE